MLDTILNTLSKNADDGVVESDATARSAEDDEEDSVSDTAFEQLHAVVKFKRKLFANAIEKRPSRRRYSFYFIQLCSILK